MYRNWPNSILFLAPYPFRNYAGRLKLPCVFSYDILWVVNFKQWVERITPFVVNEIEGIICIYNVENGKIISVELFSNEGGGEENWKLNASSTFTIDEFNYSLN